LVIISMNKNNQKIDGLIKYRIMWVTNFLFIEFSVVL